jgi:hypothetical protein
VVARAWMDDDFKSRLLADPKEAVESIGGDIGPTHLIVVENTIEVHNVIVCTLCSCYPRWLLGLPPDWYKSRAYRSRVVREPRTVLREFGTEIADNRRYAVHGPAQAPGRHGRHERGATCRHHRPGFHGRRDRGGTAEQLSEQLAIA